MKHSSIRSSRAHKRWLVAAALLLVAVASSDASQPPLFTVQPICAALHTSSLQSSAPRTPPPFQCSALSLTSTTPLRSPTAGAQDEEPPFTVTLVPISDAADLTLHTLTCSPMATQRQAAPVFQSWTCTITNEAHDDEGCVLAGSFAVLRQGTERPQGYLIGRVSFSECPRIESVAGLHRDHHGVPSAKRPVKLDRFGDRGYVTAASSDLEVTIAVPPSWMPPSAPSDAAGHRTPKSRRIQVRLLIAGPGCVVKQDTASVASPELKEASTAVTLVPEPACGAVASSTVVELRTVGSRISARIGVPFGGVFVLDVGLVEDEEGKAGTQPRQRSALGLVTATGPTPASQLIDSAHVVLNATHVTIVAGSIRVKWPQLQQQPPLQLTVRDSTSSVLVRVPLTQNGETALTSGAIIVPLSCGRPGERLQLVAGNAHHGEVGADDQVEATVGELRLPAVESLSFMSDDDHYNRHRPQQSFPVDHGDLGEGAQDSELLSGVAASRRRIRVPPVNVLDPVRLELIGYPSTLRSTVRVFFMPLPNADSDFLLDTSQRGGMGIDFDSGLDLWCEHSPVSKRVAAIVLHDRASTDAAIRKNVVVEVEFPLSSAGIAYAPCVQYTGGRNPSGEAEIESRGSRMFTEVQVVPFGPLLGSQAPRVITASGGPTRVPFAVSDIDPATQQPSECDAAAVAFVATTNAILKHMNPMTGPGSDNGGSKFEGDMLWSFSSAESAPAQFVRVPLQRYGDDCAAVVDAAEVRRELQDPSLSEVHVLLRYRTSDLSNSHHSEQRMNSRWVFVAPFTALRHTEANEQLPIAPVTFGGPSLVGIGSPEEEGSHSTTVRETDGGRVAISTVATPREGYVLAAARLFETSTVAVLLDCAHGDKAALTTTSVFHSWAKRDALAVAPRRTSQPLRRLDAARVEVTSDSQEAASLSRALHDEREPPSLKHSSHHCLFGANVTMTDHRVSHVELSLSDHRPAKKSLNDGDGTAEPVDGEQVDDNTVFGAIPTSESAGSFQETLTVPLGTLNLEPQFVLWQAGQKSSPSARHDFVTAGPNATMRLVYYREAKSNDTAERLRAMCKGRSTSSPGDATPRQLGTVVMKPLRSSSRSQSGGAVLATSTVAAHGAVELRWNTSAEPTTYALLWRCQYASSNETSEEDALHQPDRFLAFIDIVGVSSVVRRRIDNPDPFSWAHHVVLPNTSLALCATDTSHPRRNAQHEIWPDGLAFCSDAAKTVGQNETHTLEVPLLLPQTWLGRSSEARCEFSVCANVNFQIADSPEEGKCVVLAAALAKTIVSDTHQSFSHRSGPHPVARVVAALDVGSEIRELRNMTGLFATASAMLRQVCSSSSNSSKRALCAVASRAGVPFDLRIAVRDSNGRVALTQPLKEASGDPLQVFARVPSVLRRSLLRSAFSDLAHESDTSIPKRGEDDEQRNADRPLLSRTLFGRSGSVFGTDRRHNIPEEDFFTDPLVTSSRVRIVTTTLSWTDLINGSAGRDQPSSVTTTETTSSPLPTELSAVQQLLCDGEDACSMPPLVQLGTVEQLPLGALNVTMTITTPRRCSRGSSCSSLGAEMKAADRDLLIARVLRELVLETSNTTAVPIDRTVSCDVRNSRSGGDGGGLIPLSASTAVPMLLTHSTRDDGGSMELRVSVIVSHIGSTSRRPFLHARLQSLTTIPGSGDWTSLTFDAHTSLPHSSHQFDAYVQSDSAGDDDGSTSTTRLSILSRERHSLSVRWAFLDVADRNQFLDLCPRVTAVNVSAGATMPLSVTSRSGDDTDAAPGVPATVVVAPMKQSNDRTSSNDERPTITLSLAGLTQPANFMFLAQCRRDGGEEESMPILAVRVSGLKRLWHDPLLKAFSVEMAQPPEASSDALINALRASSCVANAENADKSAAQQGDAKLVTALKRVLFAEPLSVASSSLVKRPYCSRRQWELSTATTARVAPLPSTHTDLGERFDPDNTADALSRIDRKGHSAATLIATTAVYFRQAPAAKGSHLFLCLEFEFDRSSTSSEEQTKGTGRPESTRREAPSTKVKQQVLFSSRHAFPMSDHLQLRSATVQRLPQLGFFYFSSTFGSAIASVPTQTSDRMSSPQEQRDPSRASQVTPNPFVSIPASPAVYDALMVPVAEAKCDPPQIAFDGSEAQLNELTSQRRALGLNDPIDLPSPAEEWKRRQKHATSSAEVGDEGDKQSIRAETVARLASRRLPHGFKTTLLHSPGPGRAATLAPETAGVHWVFHQPQAGRYCLHYHRKGLLLENGIVYFPGVLHSVQSLTGKVALMTSPKKRKRTTATSSVILPGPVMSCTKRGMVITLRVHHFHGHTFNFHGALFVARAKPSTSTATHDTGALKSKGSTSPQEGEDQMPSVCGDEVPGMIASVTVLDHQTPAKLTGTDGFVEVSVNTAAPGDFVLCDRRDVSPELQRLAAALEKEDNNRSNSTRGGHMSGTGKSPRSLRHIPRRPYGRVVHEFTVLPAPRARFQAAFASAATVLKSDDHEPRLQLQRDNEQSADSGKGQERKTSWLVVNEASAILQRGSGTSSEAIVSVLMRRTRSAVDVAPAPAAEKSPLSSSSVDQLDSERQDIKSDKKEEDEEAPHHTIAVAVGSGANRRPERSVPLYPNRSLRELLGEVLAAPPSTTAQSRGSGTVAKTAQVNGRRPSSKKRRQRQGQSLVPCDIRWRLSVPVPGDLLALHFPAASPDIASESGDTKVWTRIDFARASKIVEFKLANATDPNSPLIPWVALSTRSAVEFESSATGGSSDPSQSSYDSDDDDVNTSMEEASITARFVTGNAEELRGRIFWEAVRRMTQLRSQVSAAPFAERMSTRHGGRVKVDVTAAKTPDTNSAPRRSSSNLNDPFGDSDRTAEIPPLPVSLLSEDGETLPIVLEVLSGDRVLASLRISDVEEAGGSDGFESDSPRDEKPPEQRQPSTESSAEPTTLASMPSDPPIRRNVIPSLAVDETRKATPEKVKTRPTQPNAAPPSLRLQLLFAALTADLTAFQETSGSGAPDTPSLWRDSLHVSSEVTSVAVRALRAMAFGLFPEYFPPPSLLGHEPVGDGVDIGDTSLPHSHKQHQSQQHMTRFQGFCLLLFFVALFFAGCCIVFAVGFLFGQRRGRRNTRRLSS